MPKKACCCNPIGRHIAVACRYYGSHTIYSLDGDVGFNGVCGACAENLTTGVGLGYGGADGFQGITSGIQKLFGWAPNPAGFGNDQSGFIHRGPVRWQAQIKQFDTSRDVVILSRSGGGSSDYEYLEDKPKGGHSAILQSRIKASLSIEGFAGIGGENYLGGFATILGSDLESGNDPSVIGGGAGGGGGKEYRGGYGGVCFGYRGAGPFGGFGGSIIAGGSAGGPCAQDGGMLIGGSGGPLSGGGGGGRYAGGGGDEESGGGGGASKWPDTSQIGNYDDLKYSEDASDGGPGGVCDPFIAYYPLDRIVYGFHAGMGGGANVIFSAEGDQNLNSITNFLGFGYDYNPFKQGIPGIITAVWIDKYCPCTQGTAGSTTGNIELGEGGETTSSENNNSSEELPSKMYICLTDEQYDVIKDYVEPNDPTGVLLHPRFTLDGETYIYFGICTNSYCNSVRVVEGTPTNLASTELGGNGAATFNITYNDCCDVMICSRYCKYPEADCYSCRCNSLFTNCETSLNNSKYCCEDLDSKPDEYWSLSEGWLWRCTKRKKFWYPFGLTPEDTLPPTNELYFGPFPTYGPFDKGCLPVTVSGLSGSQLQAFIDENCFPPNPQLNCGTYFGFYPEPCTAVIQNEWNGKVRWPVTVSGGVCAKDTDTKKFYAFNTSLPVDCTCVEVDQLTCAQIGCVESATDFSFTFDVCLQQGQLKTGGCSGGQSQTDWTRAGRIFFGGEEINANGECREVLGLTVRIPKCHLDPDNPQITDPPKYGPPGVRNSLSIPETSFGEVRICEKVVYGTGTLGQFISELTQNMQADMQISVNEPNLWLSQRTYFDPCGGEYLGNNTWAGANIQIKPDKVSRVVITETIDYQELKYYFAPIGYIYVYNATLTMRPTSQDCELQDQTRIGCNFACECQENIVKKCPDFQNPNNRFTYYSQAYYLYENSSGQAPTLVPGELIPDIEFGGSTFNGPVWPPLSLIENACPNSPSSYYAPYGLGSRSISGCITITTGPMPDCNTTFTIEENKCVAEWLSISH